MGGPEKGQLLQVTKIKRVALKRAVFPTLVILCQRRSNGSGRPSSTTTLELLRLIRPLIFLRLGTTLVLPNLGFDDVRGGRLSALWVELIICQQWPFDIVSHHRVNSPNLGGDALVGLILACLDVL